MLFMIYRTRRTGQTRLKPETYFTLVRYMVTKPLSLGVL